MAPVIGTDHRVHTLERVYTDMSSRSTAERHEYAIDSLRTTAGYLLRTAPYSTDRKAYDAMHRRRAGLVGVGRIGEINTGAAIGLAVGFKRVWLSQSGPFDINVLGRRGNLLLEQKYSLGTTDGRYMANFTASELTESDLVAMTFKPENAAPMHIVVPTTLVREKYEDSHQADSGKFTMQFRLTPESMARNDFADYFCTDRQFVRNLKYAIDSMV